MAQPSGFPVLIKFPLHWGEMDAFGHVNNTRYFTWFESARIRTFEKIGVVTDKPLRVGPILATTQCDFLRPIAYPADICVGCRVSKMGNTSMTMEYEVRTEDADHPSATGSSVIVLIDYETGAKVPIPNDIREKVSGLRP